MNTFHHARCSWPWIFALAAGALLPTSARAELVIRFQADESLSDMQVSVGDVVPLVIMEDTDYRTRAARMGCHVWCVDSSLRALSVGPPSKDGNATFTDVQLDVDSSPPSDRKLVNFTEDIADPDLWATGGPRELAVIDFQAIAPGIFTPSIQSITAFDDQGNPIPIDFDTTNPLTVTVVPEPAPICATVFGGFMLGMRRLRRFC